MGVIFIRIEETSKSELGVEAKKRGLQLATYCRMVLLKELQNAKAEVKDWALKRTP